MSYCHAFFKRKLGFVSLVLVASLVSSNQVFAMDPPQEIEDSTSPEKQTLSKEFFESLGFRAGDGDGQAQNQLIKIADEGNAEAQLYVAYMYLRELGEMWRHERGVKQDEKEAYRYFKLAAEQGNEDAQSKLLAICFEDDNQLEHLYWFLQTKKTHSSISTRLLKTPDVPVEGDSFQGLLNDIIKGINPAVGEETGFARLIKNHQLKVGMNKKHENRPGANWEEAAFAIPRLAEIYKSIVDFEEEAMNRMESLLKTKPGFMVTAVHLNPRHSISDDIIYYGDMNYNTRLICTRPVHDYNSKYGKRDPFFSLESVENVSYLSIGQENVRKAHEFVTFLEGMDKKFEEVDKKLESLSQSYEKSLEPVFGELMVKQRLAYAQHDNNYIHSEGSSIVQVKEHFTDLGCLKDADETLKEQEKKFNDLVLYMQFPLEVIEEERTLLRDLQKKIKALPARGVGSRNKDLFEEYPNLLWKN